MNEPLKNVIARMTEEHGYSAVVFELQRQLFPESERKAVAKDIRDKIYEAVQLLTSAYQLLLRAEKDEEADRRNPANERTIYTNWPLTGS